MSESQTEYAGDRITAAADAEAWWALFRRIEAMIAEREAASPYQLVTLFIDRDVGGVTVSGPLKTVARTVQPFVAKRRGMLP